LHVNGGIIDVAARDLISIEPEELFAPNVVSPQALDVPYSDLIRIAAAKYGLDPLLVASVAAAESNFNPHAVSPKNAQGVMQLMPETSLRLGVRNPFDPAESINAGARYLRELLDRFRGDLRLALAAYNAGPDRVYQYQGVPPYQETRDYVRRVTQSLPQTGSSTLPSQELPAPAPKAQSQLKTGNKPKPHTP
jgi:soluble lytic murein transglycosylase-like protein